MTTVGAYEAKTHLSQLLARVAQGERITITRHNAPIAILEPVAPRPSMQTAQVISEIKAMRRRYRLGDASISELKEEGRA